MPRIPTFSRDFDSPIESAAEIEALRRAQYQFYRRQGIVNAQNQLENRGIQVAQAFTVNGLIQQVMANATEETSAVIAAISRSYKGLMQSNAGAFRSMFDQVGQKAMLASYTSYKRRPFQTGAGSYRAEEQGKWKRDAGGKLEKALKSRNMFVATKDGLLFINRQHLDIAARQWYRLNFGAGYVGQQGRRPRSYSLSLFNTPGGKISLKDYQPSIGFKIPAGLWSKGGLGATVNLSSVRLPGQARGDQLEPIGYIESKYGKGTTGKIKQAFAKQGVKRFPAMRKRISKGIRATGFLDAGISVISREAPRGLEKLFADLAEESIGRGRNRTTRAQFEKSGVSTKELNAILSEYEKVILATGKQADATLNRR